MVKAVEKIMFCPEFKNASEVAILTDAFSYLLKVSSNCLTSYFSLLKCYYGVNPVSAAVANSGRTGGGTYLDRLVINQRVHSNRGSLVVGRVGLFTELRSEQRLIKSRRHERSGPDSPPCRRLDRKPRIRNHRQRRDRREIPTEFVTLRS